MSPGWVVYLPCAQRTALYCNCTMSSSEIAYELLYVTYIWKMMARACESSMEATALLGNARITIECNESGV